MDTEFLKSAIVAAAVFAFAVVCASLGQTPKYEASARYWWASRNKAMDGPGPSPSVSSRSKNSPRRW